MTSDESILQLCLDANSSKNCIGLITWMHTFSPARMWIAGLRLLNKPFLHLHTQFNRDIPWGEIDMDFMNLNQSAHGDREFGFVMSRMRMNRKVVVGYWQDHEVIQQINMWSRAAAGWPPRSPLDKGRAPIAGRCRHERSACWLLEPMDLSPNRHLHWQAPLVFNQISRVLCEDCVVLRKRFHRDDLGCRIAGCQIKAGQSDISP